ncbi:ABC transporter ATP-binding protein [Streptomyces sp. ISL-98]|uniref:ABC transporter ATP-binding protein n=1 Tax=Streptomyces sp. ISL-98 TaxID=2819192 RepID=UPI001BEC6101|nr:ABC transporter ATP-binding protein [Streptomyces sp. ISL-98]MBT2507368.1 ABC transporter ATP-binding protein [Streptomyces sp. ISL-98]
MARRAADRLLLAAARRGGAPVGVLAATALLLAGVYLALPTVMGRALDAMLDGRDATLWLSMSAVSIVILVVCDAADDFVGAVANARAIVWLRRTLLRHMLALGTRATRRFGAGDLVSRLVSNTARTGSAPSSLVWGITDLVPPIGGVVALALIDPWLCVTFLAGLPLVVLLVRAFVRDVSDFNEQYFATQGRIAARLGDALAGIRTIAVAGTAEREIGRVLAPLPELRRNGLGMWRAFARVTARNALVVPLLQIAVLAVAGLELSRGRITPGEVLAASEYVLLAMGVDSIVSSVSKLTFARATAARVAEVIDEPAMRYGAERLPVEGSSNVDTGNGRLEFRRVTVRTPGGAVVLDDLRLAVRGGALVAVVGRSGSGKSLLAALAGRLVDPDEGEVLLDGVPLRRLDRDELRRAVAYGFERPVLLGDTIADAIGFGPRTPSADELVAQATAARADVFIRHLPAGYGTPLAEAPMSGGEAQRIGLARAFVQAGRVLVLDDVAASLDTVTEHHISQALTGALADRTRIVVTHRASTAARAEYVVWLDGGRVRAEGTHGELWADPEYRAVFQPVQPVHQPIRPVQAVEPVQPDEPVPPVAHTGSAP